MAIADELRDWGRTFAPSYRSLDAIADRIDVEHEAACAEAYGRGVMSVPIALDESQWVKLPVDADGVPIRVGDVMERGGDTFEVIRIELDAAGEWALRGCGVQGPLSTNSCRHHHAPTVEDVLRKFIHRYDELRLGLNAFDPFELIAEFAAKLRLAGDAE